MRFLIPLVGLLVGAALCVAVEKLLRSLLDQATQLESVLTLFWVSFFSFMYAILRLFGGKQK